MKMTHRENFLIFCVGFCLLEYQGFRAGAAGNHSFWITSSVLPSKSKYNFKKIYTLANDLKHCMNDSGKNINVKTIY